MFLLDTNVLSEQRKMAARRANPNVADWLALLPEEHAFVSVITIQELQTWALLQERRDPTQGRLLKQWIDERLIPALGERLLPIDLAVARRCAELHVPHPRPKHDALLAATALVHGLTVATRDVADFAPMGVKLLNPWEPQ
jgi:toxin FitB